MSSDPTRDPAGCELHRFERNRYFNGKLMTARDMAAEQTYHASRLNTVNRLATGEGVLSGLRARVEGEADGDRLTVTVEPGVALDRCGRQVVVEDAATRTVDAPPTGDVVYVYLTYDEARRETVPVPGSEAVTEEDCTYNRVVETFAVTCEASPPGSHKVDRIPDVEFPSRREVDDDETAALGAVARSYRENAASADGDLDEGAAVLLGAFERGSWAPVPAETGRRPVAYDNDMLYAALVRHVTDFENPHEVSVDGRAVDRPSDGVPAEVVERLDALESSVEEVRGRVDSLERYVMHRSLVGKRETFRRVGREFENLTIGDIADEIVDGATDALDAAVFDDEAAYRGFVEEVSRLEGELGRAVEEENRSTEEVREQYSTAVDALADELEDDATVLGLVVAQDAVLEAATVLERAVT
jgi:hypothetical protein